MSRQFSVFATLLRGLLFAGGLMFLAGPVLLPDQFGSAYLSYAGATMLIGLILDTALRPGTYQTERPHRREPAAEKSAPKALVRDEGYSPDIPATRAVCSMPGPTTGDTFAKDTQPIRSADRQSDRQSAAVAPLHTPKRQPMDIPAGGRVLVAEDNPINAKLAQCMLQRAGCAALLVETGRAAVEAVQDSLEGTGPAIDLVLMDVHMPDLDGLAAARKIRAFDEVCGRKTPPLIAVTANAFAEDRALCLEAGMDDYLAKPFSWPELHEMLAQWLPRPANDGIASGHADDAA